MCDQVWDSCLQQEIPFELLDLPNHPKPTDVEKKLGKELTEIFLKACTPIEKVLFGRDNTLKGPEEKKMWIDPKDRVDNGKVRLTEQPLKTDCLQALTHRGILEIGEKLEKVIEERKKKELESAVKEAEDVARFEADLRIKFHVENERKKLNEEWQQHFDELVKSHEEEKKNLIKIFEDSRKVFCEFLAKKCQDEINKHVKESVVNTRQELQEECSKIIDDELAQQHTMLQESMEMTLKNLEANDRDRMNELCNQCLNAMDVHSNLMMCRQITELMHLMSTEKLHWQKKLSDLKEKYEMTIKTLENKLNSLIIESSSLKQHQSRSFIVALWNKFFKSLESIDVSDLNEGERRILNEIQRIQCELIENRDDNSSRIFLVQSDNDNEKEQNSPDENLIDDWIHQKDGECLNKGSSVAVEWKKQTLSEVSSIEDKFMSSIFHKMSKADAPANVNDPVFSKTATSIVKTVRSSENCGDKILERKIKEILQDFFIHQQMISSNDLLPLPNVDHLEIKDSRQLLAKKISMAGESVEGRHHILGVVDSLELLSQRTSTDEDRTNNIQSFNSTNMEGCEGDKANVNLEDTNLNAKLPCIKVTEFSSCLYEKMTAKEWHELKALQNSLQLKPKRHSSIHFENSALDVPQNFVKRSSILKSSSATVQRHDLNPNENALHPIQQKCHELVKNMKMKSILKLLCNDNVIDAETSSTLVESRKKL